MDYLTDKPHEECGIIGVFGHPEASTIAYIGLYALQHRGQESAGIVSSDGTNHYYHKGQGLVADVFSESILKRLGGHSAIGHVRYSTTGANHLSNVQPLMAKYKNGNIAVAHNGNIINYSELRKEMENRGSIFQSSTDSEVILHMIAQSATDNFEESLVLSSSRLKGAYSLVLLHEDKIYALKDPYGIRPLCIGKLGDAFIVASESCALDIVDAEFIKELKHGEMIVIDDKGFRSEFPFPHKKEKFCIFEYIYFSRPDSRADGKTVQHIRYNLGRKLALECPAEADIVISVPDSANPAAIGYSEESGIPYKPGLIRNHYVGRTFIEPEESIRHFGVKIKLNPVSSDLEGKRVVVIDDSIVRGTTAMKITTIIRKAGATQVHFRLTAPPWKNPCFYGIDTPDKNELIASNMNEQEICEKIGADSIGFISEKGLLECAPENKNYCMACFNGKYLWPIKDLKI
jgi:amidophosphoribosyltransferase